MTIKTKEIRAILPVEMQNKFDDIVEQKVLGASNHIKMIGEMFVSIANDSKMKNSSSEEMKNKIQKVGNYFIETRGAASQAVSNAIHTMLVNINNLPKDIINASKMIEEDRDTYIKKQTEAIDEILKTTINLTKNMNTIFVYDYSSTVDKFLRESVPKKIIISESSVINGGYPFIDSCQKAKHDMKIIPDAAIMYYLKTADCAMMGAETFYPDGTGFNTIGSDIVGLVCKTYDIPLYMLTPLIKLDMRPIHGIHKEIVFNDYREKYEKNNIDNLDLSKIDFKVPELLGLGPNFIIGFITEWGIIPADQMYAQSIKYDNKLRGDKNV